MSVTLNYNLIVNFPGWSEHKLVLVDPGRHFLVRSDDHLDWHSFLHSEPNLNISGGSDHKLVPFGLGPFSWVQPDVRLDGHSFHHPSPSLNFVCWSDQELALLGLSRYLHCRTRCSFGLASVLPLVHQKFTLQVDLMLSCLPATTIFYLLFISQSISNLTHHLLVHGSQSKVLDP
jgi:hypothetical protein